VKWQWNVEDDNNSIGIQCDVWQQKKDHISTPKEAARGIKNQKQSLCGGAAGSELSSEWVSE